MRTYDTEGSGATARRRPSAPCANCDDVDTSSQGRVATKVILARPEDGTSKADDSDVFDCEYLLKFDSLHLAG